MLLRYCWLMVIVLPIGCAPLRGLLPSDVTPEERLAGAVTITRDEWGVPHIEGETAAAVAFGLAYAQAEDELVQIEDAYLRALGRASHWYGEAHLAHDLLSAAFEVERLSREEYAREPAGQRAVWDAFAAGLNYYIRTSGVQPRLITAYEPWMPFALLRQAHAGSVIDGVRLGAIPHDSTAEVLRTDVQLVGEWTGAAAAVAGNGTSVWAVAPARTAEGHALLAQSVGGEFAGPERPYDVTLRSDDGWQMDGAVILGTPAPAGGSNDRIAWGLAPSGADHADVYEVRFDHPSDPLMYRYDGGWRSAVEWADTLLVNSPGGVVPRTFTFRRTHHGPIVTVKDGVALAVRIARMDEGGALQQRYGLSRAADLDGFRTALDARALTSSVVYADVEGNIFYMHGGAVPARDTAVDWTRPVDGAAEATAWRGWHELNELPQVLNPPGGWLQITGSGGFAASAPGADFTASPFPRYMSAPGTGTGHALRRLLAADSSWTFEEFAGSAFDTWLAGAAQAIPPLVMEWEQVGGLNAARARRLDVAVDLLRSWDHVASPGSEAATLFVLWQEQLRAGAHGSELARFSALEAVVTRLESVWESASVPWGEINRIQRPDGDHAGSFSDERVSLPAGGAPAWLGSVFAFASDADEGDRRQYGTAGTMWINAVELAPVIRSRSVSVYGQSGHADSPHYFDQAPLYARGELRSSLFTVEQIRAHGRPPYHPGAAAVR